MAFGTDASNRMGSPQAVGTTFFNKSINQSLRFTRGDSSRMLDSAIPSGGNRRLWTFSTWVKVVDNANQYNCIWGAGGTGTYPSAGLCFHYSRLQFFDYRHPSYTTNLISTAKFRDTGAWLNVVVVYDSAAATISTDKVKMFVNGERLTAFDTASYPSNDYDGLINDNTAGNEPTIGFIPGFDYSDFYLAEMYLIDGQKLTPASFGELKNGIWVPKEYTGTFGTTGFHLTFSDSSNIGNDSSGLNNHFDDVDFVVASDIVIDSPTQNFATLLPMLNTALSEGNLNLTTSRTGNWDGTIGNFAVNSGKWYYEVRMTYTTDSTFRCVAGWQGNHSTQTVTYHGKGASGSPYGTLFDNYQVSSHTTSFYKDGVNDTTDGTTTAPSSGDIINIAADFDSGKMYFGVNGTYYANDGGTDGNPSAGTNESLSGIDLTANEYVPAFNIRSDNATGGNQMYVNFGQDATFNNTVTGANGYSQSAGGEFKYQPPAGFKALKASNLVEPIITPRNDSIENSFFYTTLYEGNGGGQRVGQFLPLNEVKTVNNSISFSDNHHLDRTATAGNQSTWTFSAWIKRAEVGTVQYIWTPYYGGDGSNESSFRFTTGDQINVYDSGALRGQVTTTRVFRDTSSWMHLVLVVDLTESSASDRVKIYVDGELQDVTINNAVGTSVWGWNANSNAHRLGGYARNTTSNLVGYMADVHFADGAAYAPTYFGQTDPSTERWIPKTVTGVTYGTNGFHLEFLDNSSFGADSAGSTTWANTNITTHDQVVDTPTKNYPTFDGSNLNSWTLSEGSLYASVSSNNKSIKTTIPIFPNSGKWYWEVLRTDTASGGGDKTFLIGLTKTDSVLTDNPYTGTNNYSIYDFNGTLYFEGTNITSYGSKNQDADDIHMIAYDSFTGATWFGVNGTWYNSATASEIANGTTTNAAFIIPKHEQGHVPFIGRTGGTNAAPVVINFGQNPSFSNELLGGDIGTASDGLGSLFKYAPPTGYKALNVDNLPPKGTREIARRKTPVFTWIKNRDATDSHMLFDQVRGATKVIHTDNDTHQIESTEVNTLQKFVPGGFQIGNDVQVNTTGESYVAWNWCMHDDIVNAGPQTMSPAGSIAATGLADRRLGFSVVKFTGTGANGTVGHGLSQAPEMIMAASLETASNWIVYHKDIGGGNDGRMFLNLNLATARFDNGPNSYFQDTPPSSTVISVNGSTYNTTGNDFIYYCFHSVEGFSKFGSYSGNNNTNGTYAHCGFKPGWLLLKNTQNAATNWYIYDSKRDTYNQMQFPLMPSLNNATYTSNLLHVDFLSSGFKIRNDTYGETNTNNQNYIFWAMAEQPFKFANSR